MKKSSSATDSVDPLKDATLHALSRILDPLIHLMLETGVTVREVTHLIRHRAVCCADERLFGDAGPRNQSRIAILTGLPRSEVARALKRMNSRYKEKPIHHPSRKVLSGWFDDSAFLDMNGAPSVLPIFGPRKSFEKLVLRYGGGIPVRAMLDELGRIDAVEQLEDQRIRVLRRIPAAPKGLSLDSIALIGERGRDLFRTLTINATNPESPLLEATASIENVSPDLLAIARRNAYQQGASFIDRVDISFRNIKADDSTAVSAQEAAGSRVGVTVFYFEEVTLDREDKSVASNGRRRKNLRRIKTAAR